MIANAIQEIMQEKSTSGPGHQEVYKELSFDDQGPILSCPACNHFISAKDIHPETTTATCGHCQHVFGFEHDSTTQKLKPSLLIPDGIEVLKLRSELDMRLRWIDTTSKSGRGFLTLFTALWNLMLLPFLIVVLVSGSWGILVFLSGHLLAGIGLLWHLATIHFNRTSISVTKDRIKIRTMPLWHLLWRNKDVEASKIQQLYVTRYVQSTTNGNPNYAYALYAILKSGEKISLIRGMNHEAQVYIERSIEDYLGIKNRKVPEEAGI